MLVVKCKADPHSLVHLDTFFDDVAQDYFVISCMKVTFF